MNEGLNGGTVPWPTTTRKRGFRVAVQGFVRRLRRAWRWAFVRRLAVLPRCTKDHALCDCTCWKREMRFEWQKMPAGWRWF